MDSDPSSAALPRGDRRADPDLEYRRILTAMRLLAGQGVGRDADKAYHTLNELRFSANREIADDAHSLLDRGGDMHWFQDTIPTMSDLETVAGTSIRFYRSWRNRVRVARGLSLVVVGLLILLLWLHFSQGGVATESGALMPILLLILVVLAILISANWMFCR